MAKKKVTKSKKTSKELWVIIAVSVLILVSLPLIKSQTKTPPVISTATIPTQSMSFDFGNQKIMVGNQEITFASGSYTSSDTTYGQHTAKIAHKSINPSGSRAAAIIIDNPGGSGTFYYLIGASVIDGREVYSAPIMLGDRIAIESVSVDDPQAEDNGIITVQYLDRSPNAPFTAEPTEKMTVQYAFEDYGNLIEVLR